MADVPVVKRRNVSKLAFLVTVGTGQSAFSVPVNSAKELALVVQLLAKQGAVTVSLALVK